MSPSPCPQQVSSPRVVCCIVSQESALTNYNSCGVFRSDAYHRCMFMKSILRFTSPSDMRMLDEAFCSVKKLPYYTYFVDGQTRETMPYGMSVMQGIADTAIVLFHVIVALDMKNQGFSSGCATAGSHHMVSNWSPPLTSLSLSLECLLMSSTCFVWYTGQRHRSARADSAKPGSATRDHCEGLAAFHVSQLTLVRNSKPSSVLLDARPPTPGSHSHIC